MSKRLRLNDQIRAAKVRLVSETGEQLGIVPLEEALSLAKSKELDLAEVSGQTDPPVCKLIDYGKYLYKQKKQERLHKKSQKQTEVKGIRLSYRTGEHDLGVKIKKAKQFLADRNMVKVQLIFKGRENVHTDLAKAKLDAFAEQLAEESRIEQPPKRQGNTLIMILAPHK